MMTSPSIYSNSQDFRDISEIFSKHVGRYFKIYFMIIQDVSRYISRYVTRDIMTWKRDDMTIIKSKRFARLIQYLSKPKSGLGLGNQG